MEKVKLTEEQAEAIEYFKKSDDSEEYFLQSHADFNSGWANGWYEPLNGMPIHILAKAIYAGYEIKKKHSKYKIGDKVVRHVQGGEFHFNQLIVEVSGLTYNSWNDPQIEYEIQGCKYDIGIEYVRLADPEEVYWLETLGRNSVADFRDGDVVIDRDGYSYYINDEEMSIEGAKDMFQENDFKGLFPVESYKSFKK